MYVIVVHGGAGEWPAQRRLQAGEGVERAVEAGRDCLSGGGTALDAVVRAVAILEDDPLFNAGTGSVLNLDGEVELDAGVMISRGLGTGNVAAVKGIRNPIVLARQVMEQTSHVLLAGTGAERFARAMGHGAHDPVTEERRTRWAELRREWGSSAPEWATQIYGDTVGAVALDSAGVLAAATSTGGTALKLPGRVGDSPVPGAGIYAGNGGAVSGTGRGERLMQTVLAFRLVAAMNDGVAAPKAVSHIFGRLKAELGKDVGVVSVDRDGQIGIRHTTPDMPYGYATRGVPRPVVRTRAE